MVNLGFLNLLVPGKEQSFFTEQVINDDVVVIDDRFNKLSLTASKFISGVQTRGNLIYNPDFSLSTFNEDLGLNVIKHWHGLGEAETLLYSNIDADGYYIFSAPDGNAYKLNAKPLVPGRKYKFSFEIRNYQFPATIRTIDSVLGLGASTTIYVYENSGYHEIEFTAQYDTLLLELSQGSGFRNPWLEEVEDYIVMPAAKEIEVDVEGDNRIVLARFKDENEASEEYEINVYLEVEEFIELELEEQK